MASFMANLFPAGKHDKPDFAPRPSTPNKNNFTTPVSTPQGSPSKKTAPPGANDLPIAFENSLKLTAPTSLDTPVKLGRPQSVVTPLSPAKSNVQAVDEASPGVDESIIHKSAPTSAGSPLRKQGQENTPPPATSRIAVPEPAVQHNHAAVSRQELYQLRDSRPSTPAATKKFNTTRGLTQEELDTLQKPNVKRLVNVTQLCPLGPSPTLHSGTPTDSSQIF